MTMLLTSIAVIATGVTLFLSATMSANTEASFTARLAVFLWFASVSGAFWYLAYKGAC